MTDIFPMVVTIVETGNGKYAATMRMGSEDEVSPPVRGRSPGQALRNLAEAMLMAEHVADKIADAINEAEIRNN